eukprot:4235762-Lingulodinium_polyedra.AAC.1
MKAESHFDPVPFLPLRSAAAYLEPELLARSVPRGVPPRPRSMRDAEEVAQFCRDLDRFGKL